MDTEPRDDKSGGKEADRIIENSALVNNLRRRLLMFLDQELKQGMLDEFDVEVLSLSLGLENGRCLTLKEISESMQRSPEYIRLRQHFILQRKVKQPLFFLVLGQYARYVKLPRGIIYQLKLKQEAE
jgi:hypothetical protein